MRDRSSTLNSNRLVVNVIVIKCSKHYGCCLRLLFSLFPFNLLLLLLLLLFRHNFPRSIGIGIRDGDIQSVEGDLTGDEVCVEGGRWGERSESETPHLTNLAIQVCSEEG